MFVLSANPRLNPEILAYDRLYAYPSLPVITDGQLIILDSGAFALSFKKQRMDEAYIAKLAAHYEAYRDFKNVYFVAPDVFKYPELSMRQFEYFKTLCDVDAAPVLQFKTPNADLFSAKKQINFYRTFGNVRMICLSNHKFDIDKQAGNIQRILEMIRSAFGDIKIHVLGAGFNSLDVAKWMATGVTSMDSISYYSDAPRHKWVFGSASLQASNDGFKQTALYNAQIARKSALNYEVML